MFRSGFSCVLFPLLVWLLRKLVLGKNFFFLGHRMGPEVPWPNGARWGGSGPRKKNPFTNRAGFGSWVQTRGSGRVWKNPARTRPVAIPTCTYTESILGHAPVLWLRVLNSCYCISSTFLFFLFLFFSLVFFCVPSFFSFFVLYTMVFYTI